jgi:Trypsin-co-occurring domain 2
MVNWEARAMGERPGIPLAKAIQDLRAELLDAVAEGQGKDLRFKLQPIELELELAVTWTGEANAGVKFWVIELGGKGAAERGSTQTLKLVLEPVDTEGEAFFVRDKGR